MTAGWQYTLLDFDPDGLETEEEWAARVAAEGWRMWTPGPGTFVSVNGKQLRRWSLRRQVDRPYAVDAVKAEPSSALNEGTI